MVKNKEDSRLNTQEISLFLRSSLERVGPTGRGNRVIIRFKDAAIHSECCHHLASQQNRFKRIDLLHGIACRLVESDMVKLKSSGSILSIENDIQVKIHQESPELTQVLPWGIRRVGVPQLPSNLQKGTGVRVGVIDTGIDVNHPDLAGNYAGGINLVSSTSFPNDDNGHGTHVSGTIAAVNNSRGVVGIASQARLYAIKAFDREGNSSISDIVRGIEWAIRQNIQVLNLSFGSSEPSEALRSALAQAYRAGIVLVASAGNDGTGNSINYPARYAGVLAVGATTEGSRIASFSSRGRQLDVVAPGEDILSTGLRGTYERLSGTSMSSPHVAGVAALIVSQYPSLTPRQVNSIIRRTSIRLRGYSSSSQGSGLVNAVRIFRYLQRRVR
jgi:subtilisin